MEFPNEKLQYLFNILQDVNNELYENYGATEEIIDLQIAINKLRHKHNITDKSEQIHKTFVQ
ncbi:MAG: hypothetical protein IJP99_09800 [Methanobrevibacter sp.]|nr:hypothetical protein [Methanobrevibacter sp.]